MGKYVEANLLREERIIYEAKVSWLSQMWWLIAAVLLPFILVNILQPDNEALGSKIFLTIPFIVALSPFTLLPPLIRIKTTELVLTDKRVIAKFGFIRRQTVEISLNKVEGISVEQGLLGRLLNFGSVGINGTGGSKAPIPYINTPLLFRKEVNKQIDVLEKK